MPFRAYSGPKIDSTGCGEHAQRDHRRAPGRRRRRAASGASAPERRLVGRCLGEQRLRRHRRDDVEQRDDHQRHREERRLPGAEAIEHDDRQHRGREQRDQRRDVVARGERPAVVEASELDAARPRSRIDPPTSWRRMTRLATVATATRDEVETEEPGRAEPDPERQQDELHEAAGGVLDHDPLALAQGDDRRLGDDARSSPSAVTVDEHRDDRHTRARPARAGPRSGRGPRTRPAPAAHPRRRPPRRRSRGTEPGRGRRRGSG